MSWFFSYWSMINPTFWFAADTQIFDNLMLSQNCPRAKFHSSGQHAVHKYAQLAKNFPLRSSVLIETDCQHESLILRLLGNQVVASKQYPGPQLQAVISNLDWLQLDACVAELKQLQINEITENLQRGIQDDQNLADTNNVIKRKDTMVRRKLNRILKSHTVMIQ